METTWDGLPVAREPPFVVCVVVWRQGRSDREFLLLHRLAPGGADFAGDCAWTPPAGARQPGEPAEAAARRELLEETGLILDVVRLPASPTSDVMLSVAEAPPAAEVVLDAEHDRFEWVPLPDALARCRPDVVAAGLASAAEWLGATPRRTS